MIENWKTGLLIAALLTLPAAAFAQDETTDAPAAEQTAPAPAMSEEEIAAQKAAEEKAKAELAARTYAPDFCDFQVTFPEQPYTTRRCPPDQDTCYQLTTYTMVYDLATTVDVSVSCAPSTPENFERYNERVMSAALQGMVKRKFIKDYNINYDERDNTKQATLTGTGETGRQGKIYTAQLWVGPNSVFTLQAELVGREHPEGDKAFKDILNSIKEKPGKQLPKPGSPTAHINR